MDDVSIPTGRREAQESADRWMEIHDRNRFIPGGDRNLGTRPDEHAHGNVLARARTV